MSERRNLQNPALKSLDMEQDKENLTISNENDCSALKDQAKVENESIENAEVNQTSALNQPATTTNCKESEFYTKAQNYWSQTPATVNGMLGGLGYINALDIQGSVKFLKELNLKGNTCALDCGAGIGRVTKNLLMPMFECVDMVEQDTNFAKTAESYCTTDAGSTLGFPNRLGSIFHMGLQSFRPAEQKYDLIWSQWVLGHLTDEDLLAFFQRLQIGLKSGGYFVMKENVTSSKSIEKDETDSSVTRPLRDYENALRKSGFKIIKTTRQQSFPKGLYPVYMIASRLQK